MSHALFSDHTQGRPNENTTACSSQTTGKNQTGCSDHVGPEMLTICKTDKLFCVKKEERRKWPLCNHHSNNGDSYSSSSNSNMAYCVCCSSHLHVSVSSNEFGFAERWNETCCIAPECLSGRIFNSNTHTNMMLLANFTNKRPNQWRK